jgi:ribosome-associated translation inhibitor RaiA
MIAFREIKPKGSGRNHSTSHGLA